MVAFILPGGVPVYFFSLLSGAGAALGVGWVALQAAEKDRLPYVNAGLWALLGALFGGRIAYVAVNWVYFRQYWIEGFQVYQGGLSWPGALTGGLVMVMIYARRLQKPTGELLWTLFPLFTTMFVFICLACWVDGSAYGRLAVSYLGLPALDEFGHQSLRFPAQLIGALSAVLWFIAIDTQAERFPRPALIGWVSIFGVAVILLVVELLRADPAIYVYGTRLGVWAASGFGALSLVGVLVSWR